MRAQSIAAFQENNRNRIRLGKRRRTTCRFLEAVSRWLAVGTHPIFYVVPVTQQLCTAVEQDQYPEKATEVKKCVVGAETVVRWDGEVGFQAEGLEALCTVSYPCQA